MSQRVVAGLVSLAVIQLFEIVQVQIHQDMVVDRVATVFDDTFEHLFETTTIDQVGQVVVMGLVREHFQRAVDRLAKRDEYTQGNRADQNEQQYQFADEPVIQILVKPFLAEYQFQCADLVVATLSRGIDTDRPAERGLRVVISRECLEYVAIVVRNQYLGDVGVRNQRNGDGLNIFQIPAVDVFGVEQGIGRAQFLEFFL